MHTIMMLNQNSIIIIWLLCVASTASVSHFGLLDLRDPGDQTCSDGGVCLAIDSNVCCAGATGEPDGCMFSSGVCCQNGYFCYQGQFCSTTNPDPNNDADGNNVNCCEDAACSTVIGLAPLNIAYAEQPFYSGASGASGAGSATTTGAPATTTGAPATTTKAGGGTITSAATTTAAGGKSATSSQATATTRSKSGGRTTVQLDNRMVVFMVLASMFFFRFF